MDFRWRLEYRFWSSPAATVGRVFLLLISLVSLARASTAVLHMPDFDLWSYRFNTDPGLRGTGPTFRGEFALDGNQFLPETALDPARRAANIFAFDTSEIVPPGLSVNSYQIESVSLTLKLRNGSFGTIQYSETPESPSTALAETIGGSWSQARPIELFGVGLAQGYSFDFGQNDTEDLLFAEGDAPYTDIGYIAYPLAGGDEPGQYVDLSNNITGGYSATAMGNTTAPFVAAPWAIGKVPGLSYADPVPNNTIFTFEINLDGVGVELYLQESLANGKLAFAVTSLHAASQPGSGSLAAYPQWFMKEAVGQIGGAEPATLEIDYTIVELGSPGDFDADDDVDGRDYLLWQRGVSQSALSAEDLADWQQFYGSSPTVSARESSTLAGNISIPEPNSLMLVVCGIIINFAQRKPVMGGLR